MSNEKYTDEEKRNLEVVKEWARCWSTPGLAERMVDDIYSDSCEVFTPLQNLYYAKIGKSKKKWKRIEIRAEEVYKKREMQIVTMVPKGNIVALEVKIKTITKDGEIREEWFGVFLTIENGRIIIDHTYMEDPLPLNRFREYLSEIN